MEIQTDVVVVGAGGGGAAPGKQFILLFAGLT